MSTPNQTRSFVGRLFLTSIAYIFLLVSFLFLIAPIIRLQILPSDAETHNESKEGDSRKDTKCQDLALGLDAGGRRKKRSRYEGTGCSASRGKSLSESVQSAEYIMVWGRICDLGYHKHGVTRGIIDKSLLAVTQK